MQGVSQVEIIFKQISSSDHNRCDIISYYATGYSLNVNIFSITTVSERYQRPWPICVQSWSCTIGAHSRIISVHMAKRHFPTNQMVVPSTQAHRLGAILQILQLGFQIPILILPFLSIERYLFPRFAGTTVLTRCAATRAQASFPRPPTTGQAPLSDIRPTRGSTSTTGSTMWTHETLVVRGLLDS